VARFLIGVWPYSGHVHPSVSLARALRGRGHEVAFYSGAMPHHPVEQEGFTRFGFNRLSRQLSASTGLGDGSDSPALYAALTRRYTTVEQRSPLVRLRRIRAMYQEMIAGTIEAQVEDLGQIRRSWRPDAIVADPFLWAPFVVLHETQDAAIAAFSFYAGCLVPGTGAPPPGLGLPSPRRWGARWRAASARLATKTFWRATQPAVDRVRRHHGLAPLGMPVAAWLGRMPLHLVCSSPEFDYERRDLPPTVHYVGHCAWDGPRAEPLPHWLRSGGGTRPLVYVSEGTAQVRAPVLLKTAVEALGDLPADVVLTTGRHRDPSQIGLERVPANVRVERFVPHGDLFPRVRLVVTNGGSNTVRGALQAGVPLVVVPMEWDQLENAQRVAEVGAGLRVPLGRCTPSSLRAAVERVLGGGTFKQSAERIAASFARYGNGTRAAELLEALTEGRLAGGHA
jgi:MGT family glycosyltransferase